MDRDRWETIKTLFDAAIALDRDAVQAFLEEQCAGDAQLRGEIDGLLEAHRRAETTVDRTATLDDGARPAATPPWRLPGFEILRKLGAGGMGTVYEAIEKGMNRRVALKVMARHQPEGSKSALRFEMEAWIAGRLDHPNIVKVFGHGEWEDLRYYSMELVDGGSLHDVIRSLKHHRRDDERKLAFGTRDYIEWAIRNVIDAAMGLDYAHHQGVVHRDIKPMNLLLNRDPRRTRITDFGLAIDADATRLTSTGKLLGTPSYMAPEQILGKQNEIGPRTDVYSLGVTLFELLTLELPYRAATPQLYQNAVLNSDARRVRRLNGRVSRDLEVVVGKALEKNPGDRYESAAGFAADLDNVLNFKSIVARPATPMDRARKWIRRKPAYAALVLVLLVTVPSLIVLGNRMASQRRDMIENEINDLMFQIRRHSARREYERLIEPATQLLALSPGNEVLRDRGTAYLRLAGGKDGQEAARYCQLAVDDMTRLVEMHPDAAGPYKWQAYVLTECGRTAEAKKAEALALKYRREPPTAVDLWRDAELAFERQEYSEAVDLATEGLKLRPGNTRLLQSRALAYEELKRDEEAIADNRTLVALDPENFSYVYNLGAILIKHGDLEEGEQLVRRSQELDPGNPFVYVSLADTYLQLGKAVGVDNVGQAVRLFGQAEANARTAIDLQPDLPWPYINLGASLMEQHRTGLVADDSLAVEALDQYEKARAILQNRPQLPARDAALTATLANSCDLMIQLQNIDRAVAVCEELTIASPDDPISFYNLAGASMLTGDKDKALDALQKDLELGDTDWHYLAEDAWFEPLRGDPRFVAIVEAMKAAASEE